MIETCRNCQMLFEETSVQFYKREKKHLLAICPDCNRIDKAHERQMKRSLQDKLEALFCEETDEERIMRLSKHYTKQYGKLSAALLQMKFKLTHEKAIELLEKIERKSISE